MTTPDSAQAVALEPKTKLSGKILKTTLAGALVDIGQSVPGVIHISQLQQEAVNKVEDVVKEGQTVEVWVRRVKKDRIELTMIEPLAYEWKEIQPEMIVKGKVTRIETYGAFVDFGAERPGLIHVSELTRGYVKTASEVVKEGEEIEAKVLDVDRRKRQIRLSMKALQPEIVEEAKPEREDRKNRSMQPALAVERSAKARSRKTIIRWKPKFPMNHSSRQCRSRGSKPLNAIKAKAKFELNHTSLPLKNRKKCSTALWKNASPLADNHKIEVTKERVLNSLF